MVRLKFALLLAGLVLAAVPLSARPHHHRCSHGTRPGWSVYASWATPSVLSTGLFVDGRNTWLAKYSDDLGDIYSDYHGVTMSAGTFSAGATYKFNRWLALGADIDLSYIWNERFSAITDESLGRKTGVALMVLPKVKLYYIDRPMWRMYGSLSVGVAKYFGYDKLKGTVPADGGAVEYRDESLRGAFQFAPLGMEFGRWLYGFVETGIGNGYTGIRAGIGYKF